MYKGRQEGNTLQTVLEVLAGWISGLDGERGMNVFSSLPYHTLVNIFLKLFQNLLFTER